MNKLEVLEGFDKEEIWTCEVFTEHLMDWLAHVWIEVHWIDEVNVWILLGDVLHGCHHADEAIAEVLASVAGDEYKLLAVFETSYIVACIEENLVLFGCKGGIALKLIDHHVEGIDDGIAGDIDVAKGVLGLEVGL